MSANKGLSAISVMESVVKDLLVHGTVRPSFEQGMNFGLTLAAAQRARVTVLLSAVEPRSTRLVAPENLQDAVQGAVEATLEDDAKRIATLIKTKADEQAVPCEVLISDTEISAHGAQAGAQLARYSRVRDLVLMCVYGPLQYPRQGLVEAVLFGTGRPLLLVPAHGSPFSVRTAMVAWDATPAASRALYDAMPLLAMATEVIVVTVLGDKEPHPEESGEEVCRMLARRNISARFDPVREGVGDVGETLIKRAVGAQADLLVMGGFAHPREREFLFGSATRSVFRSGFPLPVLLSR